MEKLIREVLVLPAFDKRDTNPSKNYGIHGCNLCFYVKGEKGAVQFIIYTNWHLPHVQKELISKCHGSRTEFSGHHFCHLEPIPADIGYHSPKPMYDSQEPISTECDLIGKGKPCYYDGSSLNAEGYFQIMVEGGSEALWKALEEYYHNRFDVAL